MNAIRIYSPDGSAPFTRRVEASNIETHIAARDQFSDEAELLREFMNSDGVPKSLSGGWTLESSGTDDYGDYYRYV